MPDPQTKRDTTAKISEFCVPAANQGQIVEVAYAGTSDGHVIRRTYDAGDQSIEFDIGAAADDDEGDYWQAKPEPADGWRRMTPAELARYGLRATSLTWEVNVETEDGASETIKIEVGDEDDDGDIWAAARNAAEDWVRGVEWGPGGASVHVQYDVPDLSEDARCVVVEAEPDQATLIRAACGREEWDRCCGDDPDDHDWTSEGEGGCKENPGVWSTGGTSLSIASHCRSCGLHRMWRLTGEHDTVHYEMPSCWCEKCEREECLHPVDRGVVMFSNCDDDEPSGEAVSCHDSKDEAYEAASAIAHERDIKAPNRVIVAHDDVSNETPDGEYVVYIVS